MCARKKKMIYDDDKWLKPYKDVIDRRHGMILDLKERMSVDGSLSKGMNNHVYYGMHRNAEGNWVFREWAPNVHSHLHHNLSALSSPIPVHLFRQIVPISVPHFHILWLKST